MEKKSRWSVLKHHRAAFFVLLFCFLLPARGFSQLNEENETGVVTRETRNQQAVEATSEQSKKQAGLEKVKKVTYEDILKSPDDLKLNFEYAQSQVKEGNLLGAATTLERILLINPKLQKVRLFYAVVLYRLDNWTEARRELETLQKQKLPPDMREEVDTYLKRIKRRLRRTKVSVRQSVGFEADSNRNASPSSKRRLVTNVPVDVSGSSVATRDNSFVNVTQVNLVHDLGFQAGHEIFASFTHFQQEQTHVDSLDLQSLQYEFGANLKSKWANFTPLFYANNIFLSRETFLRTQGGEFDFDKTFGRFSAFSDTRIEHQNFSGISENPTAPQRTGVYTELENGFSYALHPRISYGASLLYGHKTAREDFNAYDRLQIRQSVTTLLWKGQFILNSIDLARDVYADPDVAIASQIRKDGTLRYRVTYGVPLETLYIGKLLPSVLRGIVWTFSYEYFRSLSNVTNYTYRNNKMQGMLTKKWEF
ncbi:MAG TPA: tetratricopeptide repeat protein [Verrucomicrobiae bacterium]|nr:tetratricopeptide repeat protein [Verrucomicrobiae bacterium]